jgi:Rps23 Pro-64 3,4-dihydroxylase Tpa1-like proline 4-hydroxylase
MDNLTDIFSNNLFKDASVFKDGKPLPMTIIDNFLPDAVANKLFEESNAVDDSEWKTFTRNGSHMKELNKLNLTPHAFELVSYLHSGHFLNQLSDYTGIPGLIPDPHMVGAGYSKSFNGDSLKTHNDFNWNDTLQLHRALSLIVYLTPDWNPAWGGALDFYDSTKENVVTSVDTLFNRCLIWQYNKFGFHGYETPISCPEDTHRTTFRAFYYTSNSTHLKDDPPHRSQYWIDPVTKLPYDVRAEK